MKSFLNFLQYVDEADTGDPPLGGSCTNIKAAFGTALTTANGITAAQSLANAWTCYGSPCADNSRVSEFYILQSDLNNAKNKILSLQAATGSDMCPSYTSASDPAQIMGKMYQIAIVFQYMNEPGVSTIFNTVAARCRAVMQTLDADEVGIANPPAQVYVSSPPTWTKAWDFWLGKFVDDKQVKMQSWMESARLALQLSLANPANADGGLLSAQASAEMSGAGGLFTDAAVTFSTAYGGIINQPY